MTMYRKIHDRFRSPFFLLALTAGLLALVVQSGELGTADTMHRLQTAHSFWTGEPQVFPNEFPEFGVHGKNGVLQSWYGIGQSLLLLPFDLLGAAIEKIPVFSAYSGTDPTVRDIVVSYCTNALLAVLTAWLCFRLLRQFEFSVKQSAAGVLALLFATTHLHYTQNMMENNYIFLLTMIGFSFQYQWLRTGSLRALLIGSAALGLNLLTRLTTGMDLLASGLLILLVLWFEGMRGREFWSRCLTYIKIATPVYLFFGFWDRVYQYHRFGTLTNTYVSIIAAEQKLLHPWYPPAYPFETPFHIGFFGALFAPEKSIFLFDPLLILVLMVSLFAWKRFTPAIKAYLVTTVCLLLVYISFYARYTVWSGDFAWGDRYVSTTVELIAFISLPLLMRHREQLRKSIWILGIFLVAASVVIQIASLAFWLPLEIYQMETLGHPTFVIALRFKNIMAFTLGKMDEWGLNNHAMTEDPWDYVHITCWNFLPFLLKRVGAAPAWVVHFAMALWIASVAALTAALLRIRAVLRTSV